jgi:catechol 2,3-dioxygenase-like lactoylglutathione lyase family enzyme
MPAMVTGLVPMVHVADVERSINFYTQLGLNMVNKLSNQRGTTVWTFMKTAGAEIMFTIADKPVVPSQQAVLFYLYANDLAGLREQLIAKEVSVSPITFPPYMKKGEICVNDPDGYCLLIGQSD